MQGIKLTIPHYKSSLPTTTLFACLWIYLALQFFYTMNSRVKMVKSEKLEELRTRTSHFPLNRHSSYHCTAPSFVLSLAFIYIFNDAEYMLSIKKGKAIWALVSRAIIAPCWLMLCRCGMISAHVIYEAVLTIFFYLLKYWELSVLSEFLCNSKNSDYNFVALLIMFSVHKNA